MPLMVDDHMAAANSRLNMVRLSMFMLRSMEYWREAVRDCDKVLILLAIVTIGGERFTRGQGLEEPLRDLRNQMPEGRLLQCNVSSVAAATGFNRETTRRKINELIEDGILARTTDGRIRFDPEFVAGADPIDLIRRQLEAIVRLTNDLLRDGVLVSSDPTGPEVPLPFRNYFPPILRTFD